MTAHYCDFFLNMSVNTYNISSIGLFLPAGFFDNYMLKFFEAVLVDGCRQDAFEVGAFHLNCRRRIIRSTAANANYNKLLLFIIWLSHVDISQENLRGRSIGTVGALPQPLPPSRRSRLNWRCGLHTRVVHLRGAGSNSYFTTVLDECRDAASQPMLQMWMLQCNGFIDCRACSVASPSRMIFCRLLPPWLAST